MRLKTVLFIIWGLCIITAPIRSAQALSCVQPSLERDASIADAVFSGRIIKIEPSTLMEHTTIATVIVTKAHKGLETGETIYVMQKHWLHTPDEWHESTNDKKAGIFALRHIKNMQHPDGLVDLRPDVYFVGMCGVNHWPTTPENERIILQAPTDSRTHENKNK